MTIDEQVMALLIVLVKNIQGGKLTIGGKECVQDIFTQIHTLYLAEFERMLPKDSFPLAGSLEDKYGYLAGQRKGFNACLAEIKAKLKDMGKEK